MGFAEQALHLTDQNRSDNIRRLMLLIKSDVQVTRVNEHRFPQYPELP